MSRGDNHTAICERLANNVWSLLSQNPVGLDDLLQEQFYFFTHSNIHVQLKEKTNYVLFKFT
jgi:hypothetical protein